MTESYRKIPETHPTTENLNPTWYKPSNDLLMSIFQEHNIPLEKNGKPINPNGLHLALVTEPSDSEMLKYLNPFGNIGDEIGSLLKKVNHLPGWRKLVNTIQSTRETNEGLKTITLFTVNLSLEVFDSRYSLPGLNGVPKTFNQLYEQNLLEKGFKFKVPQLEENPPHISLASETENIPSPSTLDISWHKTHPKIVSEIKRQHEPDEFPKNLQFSPLSLRLQINNSSTLAAQTLSGIENEFNSLLLEDLKRSRFASALKHHEPPKARFIGCSNKDYSDSFHTLMVPKFLSQEKINNLLKSAIENYNESLIRNSSTDSAHSPFQIPLPQTRSNKKPSPETTPQTKTNDELETLKADLLKQLTSLTNNHPFLTIETIKNSLTKTDRLSIISRLKVLINALEPSTSRLPLPQAA